MWTLVCKWPEDMSKYLDRLLGQIEKFKTKESYDHKDFVAILSTVENVLKEMQRVSPKRDYSEIQNTVRELIEQDGQPQKIGNGKTKA